VTHRPESPAETNHGGPAAIPLRAAVSIQAFPVAGESGTTDSWAHHPDADSTPDPGETGRRMDTLIPTLSAQPYISHQKTLHGRAKTDVYFSGTRDYERGSHYRLVG
jgi:hypothetical protein